VAGLLSVSETTPRHGALNANAFHSREPGSNAPHTSTANATTHPVRQTSAFPISAAEHLDAHPGACRNQTGL
jgi:hypothetical protein